MKRLFVVFIFCFLFVNQVRAENVLTPVVAYSKVDKIQATTGDTIQYEINIDYDKRINPKFPDIKKNLEDFRIIEELKQPEKNIDNRLIKTFNYKIQAKEPGSYIIKPIVINYDIPENLKKSFIKGNSTKTSKIYIDIKSVLKPEDKNKDIDDIKDIENIDVLDYKKIILYVLGPLFIIIIIVLAFKLFKKSKKDLLPHEWAVKEIDLLKKDGINQKMLKPTYFRLSEIIRIYLEKRFNIPALSMTSNQIQNIYIDDLSIHNKKFINEFIEKTDFYKYTDNIGNYQECLLMIDELYNFIDSTKPIIEKDKSNAK